MVLFEDAVSSCIPLHILAGSASPYAVFMAKALLERGLDPNKKNEDGVTPVHVAACWGRYETLKLLLFNGGDPTIEDDDGKTPLQFALDEGHFECAHLLQSWSKSTAADTPDYGSPTMKYTPGQRSGYSPTMTPTSYSPKYFQSPLHGASCSAGTKTSDGTYSPTSAKIYQSPSAKCYSSSSPLRKSILSGVLNSADSKARRMLHFPPANISKCEFQRQSVASSPGKSVKFSDYVSEQSTGDRTRDVSSETYFSAASRPVGCKESLPFIDDANDSSIGCGNTLEYPTVSTINCAFLEDNDIFSFSEMLSETLNLDAAQRSQLQSILEQSMLELTREIDPKRLSECKKLTDAELRRQATNQGVDVGPITDQTRFLYVRHLAALLTANAGAAQTPDPKKRYLPEIRALIDGRLDVKYCKEDEFILQQSFANPQNGRRWREGRLKMSFCYLLIDPTITKNLPNRSSDISESERLQRFVESIFYVGKGKKSRPLQHLLDAAVLPPNETNCKNEKLTRIVRLWRQGHGVVSLNIFHNVIPAEAYTREAAMIDALGLDKLCNLKRGDYYGAAANWALGRRRRFGAYLLKIAAAIYMLEGERQLRREDILKRSP